MVIKKSIIYMLIFLISYSLSYSSDNLITARYNKEIVDSLANSISDSLKLQSIESDSVSIDGTSKFWIFRYISIDSSYYFHTELDTAIFDSSSHKILIGASIITKNWIDSDSALSLAESQGGYTFRISHPDYIIKASLREPLVPYSYPQWYITYVSKENPDEKILIIINATKQDSFPPPEDLQLEYWYHLANYFQLKWDLPDTTQTDAQLVGYYIYRNFVICNTLPSDSTTFLEIEPPTMEDCNVYYFLKAFYENPEGISIPTDTVFHDGSAIGIVVIDPENSPIPQKVKLFENYPNPFNPITKISYQLPKSLFVKLSVYDLNGRLIETLVNEQKSSGYFSIEWIAENLGSGIYFYRIDAGDPSSGSGHGFTYVKKCIILK